MGEHFDFRAIVQPRQKCAAFDVARASMGDGEAELIDSIVAEFESRPFIGEKGARELLVAIAMEIRDACPPDDDQFRGVEWRKILA